MCFKQTSSLITNNLLYIQIHARYAMVQNQMLHLSLAVIISHVLLAHRDVNAVLYAEFLLMILLNCTNNEIINN